MRVRAGLMAQGYDFPGGPLNYCAVIRFTNLEKYFANQCDLHRVKLISSLH